MDVFILGACFGAFFSLGMFFLALKVISVTKAPGHGKPLPFAATTEEQEARVENTLRARWNDAVEGLGR